MLPSKQDAKDDCFDRLISGVEQARCLSAEARLSSECGAHLDGCHMIPCAHLLVMALTMLPWTMFGHRNVTFQRYVRALVHWWLC